MTHLLAPPDPGHLIETAFALAWAVAAAAAVVIGAALALATLWALAVALDVVVLPLMPPAAWKRPWCWLQGHVNDDREAGDPDPHDRCQRCDAGLGMPPAD